MKVYISASIINTVLNERVTRALEDAGHEVFLPQLFCPTHLPHESYPEAIFRQCIDAMEDCDIGIIMLDCYGRDSSWECGWFESKGKPIVGFITSSLKCLKDWMIKGGLEGVITTDEKIMKRLIEDEILGKRLLTHIKDIEMLGPELEKHLTACCKTDLGI